VGISGGILASLAGRYASALYDLANTEGSVATIEGDFDQLTAAIAESADLAQLLHDPQVSRAAATGAIKAVGDLMSLNALTGKFLGVLAQNRRLATLPDMIAAFRAIAADARGEITADVTTAHPLPDDQLHELSAKLAQREGRAVTLHTHVDPAILGGLVVQIGSQMVDNSIRTRLNSLAQAIIA
jgi:F-type H+-transporting ATPase subunit delta